LIRIFLAEPPNEIKTERVRDRTSRDARNVRMLEPREIDVTLA
jgi:hypothetical protein